MFSICIFETTKPGDSAPTEQKKVMESVKNREVKFNKEGVMIVKTTYQAFNRSFRRNINVVKWTASFEGEFATGYTMKDAVHRVMKEVNKKIN